MNQANMRLVDYKRMHWQNRAHFFAVSAQVMRRILVDYARRRTVERGRGVVDVLLDEVAQRGDGPLSDIAALDNAMEALARVDERKARVVEMRFFGGLTVEEIAAVRLYREQAGGMWDGS